jgi:hypothetical protein
LLQRLLRLLFAAASASAFVAGCGGSDNGGSAVDGGNDDAPPFGLTLVQDASGHDDGALESDGALSDAGGQAFDGPFVTAPHPPQPQVVNSLGTVLQSPKVQLIVYSEDPNLGDVEAMLTELSKTSTWSEQTSEYGVGPLTILPTIQIPGTPPATLNGNGSPSPFEQTLVANTTGGDPAWGAADPNTIYTFLLPYGTNIQSSGNCCVDYYGYHYEVPVTSTMSLSYAIVCTCNSVPGTVFSQLTQLENVTTTVDHELVEAVTDPLPLSAPAWSMEDQSDMVWLFATGGEIADMCEYNADANFTPPGSTYMVQRSWSNVAAKAGTNPCVPVPKPTPYFDAIAVLPDTVSLAGGYASKGVHIPIGGTATVDVQLFSTAPTSGPWRVSAYDLNYYLGYPPNTTVKLDKTTGSNGDVLHLTIHVVSQDTRLGLGGEGFVLLSDLGGQENMSFGAVGN